MFWKLRKAISLSPSERYILPETASCIRCCLWEGWNLENVRLLCWKQGLWTEFHFGLQPQWFQEVLCCLYMAELDILRMNRAEAIWSLMRQKLCRYSFINRYDYGDNILGKWSESKKKCYSTASCYNLSDTEVAGMVRAVYGVEIACDF